MLPTVTGDESEKGTHIMEVTLTHLVLAVRPATYLPYRIEGGEESCIESYHACVRDAETVIRAFCREHRCTATVRVFTPRNKLWSTNEIAADGSVTSTRPRWLTTPQREAA